MSIHDEHLICKGVFEKIFYECCFYTVYKGDECVGKDALAVRSACESVLPDAPNSQRSEPSVSCWLNRSVRRSMSRQRPGAAAV